MKKQYLCAATSILCWSTVAAISKILLNNLSTFQVLWASSFCAALFLLIVNIAKGNLKILKQYSFKDIPIMALISFPGTFMYYMFYYMGVERMPASQAFIVNYMWPIMSVVFACIILKEKLTSRKIIAIIISFLGLFIVTGSELLQFNPNILTGALFCLLGAMSYGVFTSLSQKMNYNKWISMMINYTVTFVITSVILVVKGEIFAPSLVQIAGFTWNGAFTMALANTLWVIALEKGNTAKISNLAYITPFLSLVWTSLLLHEEIKLNSIAGLVVIILGIFIQLKSKSSKTTN